MYVHGVAKFLHECLLTRWLSYGDKSKQIRSTCHFWNIAQSAIPAVNPPHAPISEIANLAARGAEILLYIFSLYSSEKWSVCPKFGKQGHGTKNCLFNDCRWIFFIMWYTARCEVLAMYYLVPLLLILPLISMYFVLNTTFACTTRHILMVGNVRCTLVLTVVRCRYAWSYKKD